MERERERKEGEKGKRKVIDWNILGDYLHGVHTELNLPYF